MKKNWKCIENSSGDARGGGGWGARPPQQWPRVEVCIRLISACHIQDLSFMTSITRYNPSFNGNRSAWWGNASHLHTQTRGPSRLRPAMTEVDSQEKMQLSLSTADTECCTHSLIPLIITLMLRWFKAFLRLASLINEDLGPSDHPEKICYSLIMSFQINMFSFWKYYLGKLAANDLLLGSMSWHFGLHYQLCVVWCPRAAGMKREDVGGGGSKICSKLTVNMRKTMVAASTVSGVSSRIIWTWLTGAYVTDLVGDNKIFLLFFKQKLTSDWIWSFLARP